MLSVHQCLLVLRLSLLQVHALLPCPFFARPLALLELTGGRRALLLPDYGRKFGVPAPTAAARRVSLQLALQAALSVGAALVAIHGSGQCYGDIKPEHVVGRLPAPVLIDGGSLVSLEEGTMLRSYTPAWAVGQEPVASRHFDLVCLAHLLVFYADPEADLLLLQSIDALQRVIWGILSRAGAEYEQQRQIGRLANIALHAYTAEQFCGSAIEWFPAEANDHCPTQVHWLRLHSDLQSIVATLEDWKPLPRDVVRSILQYAVSLPEDLPS